MTRSLFGPPEGDPEPKPAGDEVVRMQVLVTVKAALNPSERYGETVCVAGIRAELTHPGWVRLYPINLRDLPSDETPAITRTRSHWPSYDPATSPA